MRVESVAKSIRMLKEILDGKTYGAIAQASRLSRSAVEQRVKALARDLRTVVGVEWVDADDVPTVQGLRARKENYLEALEHYHPQRVVNAPKGPRALTDQDIDRAAAVIRQHSNCRKRDTALLLVLFSTAAKPLEIARLEVSDYLNEDGSLREASVLRANAAAGGNRHRPDCLAWARKSTLQTFDPAQRPDKCAQAGLGNRKGIHGRDRPNSVTRCAGKQPLACSGNGGPAKFISKTRTTRRLSPNQPNRSPAHRSLAIKTAERAVYVALGPARDPEAGLPANPSTVNRHQPLRNVADQLRAASCCQTPSQATRPP